MTVCLVSENECLLWKHVWGIQSPASHTLNAPTLTRLLIKDCIDDTTMLSPEIADIVETLRENEQYVRTVADSAPDVAVSIHKQGTIAFAGKVAEAVFGYSVVLLNAESQEVTAFG